MQEALFCQALGLAAPWEVERVALDVAHSRIDLYVVWRAKTAACPACSTAEQKLHDHRPLRQNSCRPNRSKNLGAAMKDANGTIRTDIQRQSGSATATARERHSGSGSPGSRHWSGNTAALA